MGWIDWGVSTRMVWGSVQGFRARMVPWYDPLETTVIDEAVWLVDVDWLVADAPGFEVDVAAVPVSVMDVFMGVWVVLQDVSWLAIGVRTVLVVEEVVPVATIGIELPDAAVAVAGAVGQS